MPTLGIAPAASHADGVGDAEPPSGHQPRGQPRRRRAGGGPKRRPSHSPALRLAELRVADRDRVTEILARTRAFSPAEIAVAIELFDAGVTSLPATSPSPTSPDYRFLGAFTPDAGMVAYACWGPTPATDGTWDLYWIAVDPALHGSGIGTRLLAEVERKLVEQHARMLVVETSSRSDYAHTRAFYRQRGYQEAARVRDFYAPGDDRIIYVKRFPDSPDRRGAQRHE